MHLHYCMQLLQGNANAIDQSINWGYSAIVLSVFCVLLKLYFAFMPRFYFLSTLTLSFVLNTLTGFAQTITSYPDLVVKGEPIVNVITQRADGGYFLGSVMDRINGLPASSLSAIDVNGDPIPGFQPVVTNNRIYEIRELSNGKILIAGTFDKINGVATGNLVRLNSDGSIDQNFSQLISFFGSYVLSFRVQQSGKIVVCGNFTVEAYNNLVRLNEDGSVDNSFTGLPTNPYLQQIRLDGSDNIYINTVYKILKLDPNGQALSGFPIEAPSGSAFYGIESYGDKLVVNGSFNSIGGQTRKNLAVINEDGTIGSFTTPFASSEGRLAVRSDGMIILSQGTSTRVFTSGGGLGVIPTFGYTERIFVDAEQRTIVTGRGDLSSNGVPTPIIVRFNTDFSLDESFNCKPSYSAGLKAIVAYPDGKMLLGGNKGLSGIGTNGTSRLARLLPSGELDETFVPELPNEGIVSVALQGEKILVCTEYSLRRLNASGTLDNTFSQKNVTDWDRFTKVKIIGSSIYISGSFADVNGKHSPGIVRLTQNGDFDNSFTSGFDFASILDFAPQSNGKIVVVGAVSVEESLSASVARITTSGSVDGTFLAGNNDGNGSYAVAVDSQDRIYVGGDFNSYSNSGIGRLIKLDPDGAQFMSFNAPLPFGIYDRITTLTIADDNEIIASVEGEWKTKVLAAIDSTGQIRTKTYTSFGPNSTVNSSFFDGFTLYLSGRLASANDDSFSPVVSIPVNQIIGTVDDLAASRVTATSIQVSWTNNTIKAKQFLVERSINNNTSYELLATLPATQTSVTDNGAQTRGNRYYYRVKAVNSKSESEYAAEANVPEQLWAEEASDIDTVAFTAHWNTVFGAEGYKIVVSSDNFSTIAFEASSNATSIRVEGLQADTEYQYRVYQLRSSVYSLSQNTIQVRTSALAPTFTAIEVLSRKEIRIEWTNRYPSATSILVYRSTTENGNYTLITTLPAGNTNYTDGTLSGETKYFFKLRATSATNSSLFSLGRNATTDPLLLQTITFPEIQPAVYSHLLMIELQASSSAGLPITFASDNEAVGTIAGNILEVRSGGDVSITATQSGNQDYKGVSKSINVHIERATQTIDYFGPLNASYYPDLSWNINVQTSNTSKLPISFSSSNESVLEIIGNFAFIRGAGTTYITLSQAGDERYKPAEKVVQITVAKATQQVTFGLQSEEVEYGKDSQVDFEASASSELPVTFLSDNVDVLTIDGNKGIIQGAGIVNVRAVQEGNKNYEGGFLERQIIVKKGTQTIQFKNLPSSVTVLEGEIQLEATVSTSLPISFESSNTDRLIIEGNKGIVRSAGPVYISALQAGDNNYESAVITQLVEITKVPQVIIFELPARKTYGDASFNLAASSSADLPISYSSSDPSIALITGQTLEIRSAGTVVIKAAQAGNETFKEEEEERTLLIDKATQTISFALPEQINFSESSIIPLVASSSSGLPIEFETSDERIATISGSNLVLKAVGDLTVTAIQPGNTNFLEASQNRTTKVLSITGLKDEITPEVLIYPNPTTGIVHFKKPDGFEDVSVVSLTGSPAKAPINVRSNVVQMDLSENPTGIYLALVKSRQKVYVVKLVKY